MNKNILNKLSQFEKNIELSEVNVELAISEDLKKLTSEAKKSVESFLNATKIIFAQKDNAISDGTKYVQSASQIDKLIKNFESKAKDLGIDANSIPEYKEAVAMLVRYDIDAVFQRVDSFRSIK